MLSTKFSKPPCSRKRLSRSLESVLQNADIRFRNPGRTPARPEIWGKPRKLRHFKKSIGKLSAVPVFF
jgi:hypothetical protein